jgi:hypothetical protein
MTIILRHCDEYLDSYSKHRYRTTIESKLGIKLPSPENESRDTAPPGRKTRRTSL